MLHMLYGRIASGKSTLAARLAREHGAVLLAEDPWLSTLFGDRMSDIADYVECSRKLRAAMGPHVVALLEAGVPVVLDFPANTARQRSWMRAIIDATGAPHRLHVLDVPEEICLARLRARNASGDHPFAVTDEQFRMVNRHVAPPTADEGFDIVVHRTQV